MTILTSLLQDRAADALAWALVHFLWQGAALAIVAFAVMRWLTTTASTRYIAGVATLALMVAAPVITFNAMLRSSTPAMSAAFGDMATSIESAAGAALFQPRPIMLGLWMIGVTVLSIRLLGGWMVTRRLAARAIEPVSAEIDERATRVADRLELRRLARVVESSAVSVPVVIGWMKPVVLLPAAALSGLTLAQVESLLAHELAHVRRHDYLVNILQAAIETLLFYHPAVWWLSKRVRTEREHCCDDLAVSLCDRVVYVSALTDLAAMSAPTLALAATDGPLLTRVRRILNGDQPARPASGWVAVGALVLVLAALAPIVMAARAEVPTTTPIAQGRIEAAPVVGDTQVYPEQLDGAKQRLDQAKAEVARLDAERKTIEQARTRRGLELKVAQTTDGTVLPRVVHSVHPTYPAVARATSMQGVVIMDVTVMSDGKLGAIVVTKSGGVLDAAAMDAVRQWQFLPATRDGKPIMMTVPVTMTFSLAGTGTNGVPAANIGIELPARTSETKLGQTPDRPRKIKSVSPVYPAAARAARMQGMVILDAMVLKTGVVGDVTVTRSGGVFDAAAIAAVRQWIYEPARLNGQPIDMAIPVTVDFTLANAVTDRVNVSANQATDPQAQDVVRPRKIKGPSPTYPQAARDAKAQGMVILNATVRKDGTVGAVTVTRSAGVLDDAAIAAVRQWIYQPARRNGQPTDMDISITVNFTLTTPSDESIQVVAPIARATSMDQTATPNTRDAGVASPRVVTPVQTRTLPKVLKSVQPKYTQRAMDAKIEGTVSLEVEVRKDGTVGDVKVTKGLDIDLDKAAVDSAKQWIFQPATLDGKPVDYDATLEMAFRVF